MTSNTTPRRCLQTGLALPECSCRHRCRALLCRFAPQLTHRIETTDRADAEQGG
jgi:hypothetical protein